MIGERIRNLRTAAGLTQEQLAQAIGATRSALNMWECEEREVKQQYLLSLADFFSVTTDYLLGRTECKSPDVEVQAACERYGLSERALYLLKFSNEIKEEGAAPNFYFCRLIDFLIKNMQWGNACEAFEALETIKEAIKKEEACRIEGRFTSCSPLPKDHIQGASMTIPLKRAKEVYAQMISNNVLNILLENNPTPDAEEF